jgi:hypothetical protein
MRQNCTLSALPLGACNSIAQAPPLCLHYVPETETKVFFQLVRFWFNHTLFLWFLVWFWFLDISKLGFGLVLV